MWFIVDDVHQQALIAEVSTTTAMTISSVCWLQHSKPTLCNPYQVCSCIAELFLIIESSNDIEEKWTQLLPVLFNYVNAQDERLNDAALMIFAEIGMYVVNQL